MDMERAGSHPRTPRTFDEIRAILPQFKTAYLERPPVIGAGLGAETKKRGSRRFVFNVYLEATPTGDQQKNLKKTFKGVPIRYELTGPFVAAGTAVGGSIVEAPMVTDEAIDLWFDNLPSVPEEEIPRIDALIDEAMDHVLNREPGTTVRRRAERESAN